MNSLWLDDLRRPPADLLGGVPWFWAKTYAEAVGFMMNNSPAWASLDHDLADEHYRDLDGTGFAEKTGYDFTLWMAEHNVWPTEGCVVHSWNSGGARRMCGVIDRYGPFAQKTPHIPAPESLIFGV